MCRRNQYSHCYANWHSDPDLHKYADIHHYANTHSDADPDGHTHWHASYGDEHPYGYPDFNCDGYADDHPNRDSDPYKDSDT